MDSKFSNLFKKVKGGATEALLKSKELIHEHDDKIQNITKGIRNSVEEAPNHIINASKGVDDFFKNSAAAIKSFNSEDIQLLEHDIANQGSRYREIKQNLGSGADRYFLLGDSVANILDSNNIDPLLEKAYAAAYPAESENVELLDKLTELESSEALAGLLAGIKGKLFELKYVDYLNKEQLPEGYVATIAEPANQPGWDIKITGPDPDKLELIQLKATNSIDYVQEAIEKYPDIDVVTTEEVYSELVLQGATTVTNSEISEASLSVFMEETVSSTQFDYSFVPPVLTLAFIAFTSYKDENLKHFEKSRQFGERASSAYLSYIIGNSLMAISQTWWLGLLGTVASHKTVSDLLKRGELIRELQRTKENNRKLINKISTVSESPI